MAGSAIPAARPVLALSGLCGEHEEPGPAVGDSTPLRLDGKRIGSVLRTRAGTKPIFVSPGHRIGFPQAERWVLGCGGGYRQPEPTRVAHKLANCSRNGLGA